MNPNKRQTKKIGMDKNKEITLNKIREARQGVSRLDQAINVKSFLI